MGVPFSKKSAPPAHSSPSNAMPQSMTTGHDEARERGTNSQSPVNPAPYPSAASTGQMPDQVRGARSNASTPAPSVNGLVAGHDPASGRYPRRAPRKK